MKKVSHPKIQEIRVQMGIFDFTVIVLIGDYSKACRRVEYKFEAKDANLERFDMGYIPRGKCFFRRGYVPIIWIPRKPKTPREQATLAHESLHSVYHLMEWANIPMTRDTEEAVTHSMAHIINTVLSKVK